MQSHPPAPVLPDRLGAPPLRSWLEAAAVAPEVAALRPDYRALLIAADGLRPGPGDAHSETLLAEAEARVRAEARAEGEAGGATEAADHPHIAAWHEAFRAFGAKPRRTRPSVDALLRRASGGLPRVDRLTDVYNAVSVAHAVPIGGEDLDRYAGPARLVRADGTEPFETGTETGIGTGADTGAGTGDRPAVGHPRPGEVVWRDDAGVTCRRWNWRQCTRTRLTRTTTRAVFILDALAPLDDEALALAGQVLTDALVAGSPDAVTASRLLRA